MVEVKEETVQNVRKHLQSELKFYKAIDKKFKKSYKTTLRKLEKEIETKGVPTNRHMIWEDSIEWRNALEEIERTRKILRELQS